MAEILDAFPDDILGPSKIVEEELPTTGVTQAVITKSLTALAWRAGRYSQAIEDLKAVGIIVKRSQLVSWEQTHKEDYLRIRDNFKTSSEAEMVGEIRDIIHQAADAERLAIEKTLDGLENTKMNAKDASQAAFNMARVKQSNVDKLQTLLGRPTQIIEDRSVQAAINRLTAKRILKPLVNGSDDDDN